MSARQKAILIVEDNHTLNDSYFLVCWSALSELASEGLSVNGEILQAYSLAEARRLLSCLDSLDLILVDLALHETEQGLRNEDRVHGYEAGGILLLKQLQEEQRNTLAIVVSGETLLSYATDALVKYRVLHYFEKARLNIEQYKAAIKVVAWYWYAADMLAQLERNEVSFDTIEAINAAWQHIEAAATIAGFDIKRLPMDLALNVRLFLDKFIDPITHLPVGRLTQHYLKTYVLKKGWSLLRVQIGNFAAFRATYPSQVEPLLFFVAALIQQAVTRYSDAFIGLLGSDIVPNPTFVVALAEQDIAPLLVVQQAIETSMHNSARTFTSSFRSDTEHVVPLVRVMVWDNQSQPFTDIHELLDAIGTIEGAYHG